MFSSSADIDKSNMPMIFYFRYWFQTKFKEGSQIKQQGVKIEPPTVIKNFIPGNKYVMFEIVKSNKLPKCEIQVQDFKKVIDLRKNNGKNQNKQSIGNYAFIFTFELLSSTATLSDKYTSEKFQEEEKHRFVQKINDLIRAQAQFISKYDKDEDLELFRQIQKLEVEKQDKINAQILEAKQKSTINFKKLFIIFLIFFLIGYLLSSHQDSLTRRSTKKTNQQKKKNPKSKQKQKQKSKSKNKNKNKKKKNKK